jgi:Domain of unknown function (DUF4162)
VLPTTQHLEEAGRLADRIVLIENGCAVADGTPDQLKDLVGSTVLEARVAVTDTGRAAALLADLGQRRAGIDPQEQRITIPGISPQTLPTVSSRLAEARVEVIELGVRRPSLEEVFLALTGPAGPARAAGRALPASTAAQAPGGGIRRRNRHTVPAPVLKLGIRADRHHARLAAADRTRPARHRDDQRGARPHQRPARPALALAVTRMVDCDPAALSKLRNPQVPHIAK